MDLATIRTSIKNIVAAELGASYHELPYQFRIEENDSRHLSAGYSILLGDGTQIYLVDQAINIEQDIQVIITKRVYIRNDDEKIFTDIDTLYSSIGNIIKRCVNSNLEIPEVVQEVHLDSLGKPEGLENGRDIVSIPLSFRVRYLIT